MMTLYFRAFTSYYNMNELKVSEDRSLSQMTNSIPGKILGFWLWKWLSRQNVSNASNKQQLLLAGAYSMTYVGDVTA